MNFQKLVFAATISLTASLSFAKYYLDLPTRQIVTSVEVSQDQQAQNPNKVFVREYLGEDDENYGYRMPVLSREKKDLIDVLGNYKGTQSGHKIIVVDPSTGKETKATVIAFFANNTLRANFVYYGSTIQHSAYDISVDLIKDRQVLELNGVKKDQKLCAINKDKKIKAGEELEVDGVWTSGMVDVNKGALSEIALFLSLSSQKQTHITNLKACE